MRMQAGGDFRCRLFAKQGCGGVAGLGICRYFISGHGGQSGVTMTLSFSVFLSEALILSGEISSEAEARPRRKDLWHD